MRVIINDFAASLTPPSLCSKDFWPLANSTARNHGTVSSNSAKKVERKDNLAFSARPPFDSFDRTRSVAALMIVEISTQGELDRERSVSSALSTTF